MSKKALKESMTGIVTAFALLLTVVPEFGIIQVVKHATGWKMPKWLAVTIAGMGAVGAIASALATFGVTLPAAVLKTLAITTSAAA